MNRPIAELPLCKMLGIEFPLIVAPMFLVSNEKMIVASTKAGVTGAIPALNYRTIEEFKEGLRRIKRDAVGPFGVNLIVNRSNIYLNEQLNVCCEVGVDFIITSLGSPEEVIQKAHKKNILVFCDVTNEDYAQKVEKLGADALIAVNKEAGGHAGNVSYKELIPKLKKACTIPVISAGGVGNGLEAFKMLQYGADGLSVGSIFIASEEADVSHEYKQACIDYGAQDIVMTTKLSGTPCTVINTPFVQKSGTKQNWLESILNKNKKLKKWFKAFTFLKGMKKLRKAAFSNTYKTVWCAGPSIEHVKRVESIETIVKRIRADYQSEFEKIQNNE